MLDKVKLYFGITDTSKDSLINLIIDTDTDLVASIGASPDLILSMVIEDYSRYLKSGNSSFTTAQASEGIGRYSPELYELIKQSIQVVVF